MIETVAWSLVLFGGKKPGNGMDARGFQTLFKRHRRQDRRDPFGEHGLACSGRTDKKPSEKSKSGQGSSSKNKTSTSKGKGDAGSKGQD